jgi:hypothetical protein
MNKSVLWLLTISCTLSIISNLLGIYHTYQESIYVTKIRETISRERELKRKEFIDNLIEKLLEQQKNQRCII